MPAFKVTLKNNQTGRAHHQRIEASRAEDVGGMVDLSKMSVVSAEMIDESGRALSPAGEVVYPEGGGFGTAATIAALVGLFFVPSALVSIILSGFALEKSKGKIGSGSLNFSAVLIIVWAILIGIFMNRFHLFG